MILPLLLSRLGMGIPETEIHKVFEKFYQIDPNHTGQVRLRLGLFYARSSFGRMGEWLPASELGLVRQ
jgi:signal transduction histidine kinase